jgi:hypothetical protein
VSIIINTAGLRPQAFVAAALSISDHLLNKTLEEMDEWLRAAWLYSG